MEGLTFSHGSGQPGDVGCLVAAICFTSWGLHLEFPPPEQFFTKPHSRLFRIFTYWIFRTLINRFFSRTCPVVILFYFNASRASRLARCSAGSGTGTAAINRFV